MKRFKIFFIFFSFLAILSFSFSCSSTNIETNITSSPPQDVTGSLPLAFQGMTSGGMGNPDAEIKLDTTLPEGVSQIMVYRIEKIGDSEALAIAENFGLENNPIPFNPSSPNAKRAVYSYTDNNKTLEVYPIGRFILRDSKRSMTSLITLPSEEECIDIAKKYLQSKRIYPDDVVRVKTGVSSTVSHSDAGSGQSAVFQPTSFTVSFISATNGFERFSSGASVTLGDQGKIVQLTVYNPTIKEYGTAALKTPEISLNTLKSYLTTASFNPPEAKECVVNWNGFQKLTIKKVSLQYNSTDYSEYLQPIYVFEGEVQESLNNPNIEQFVGRVDAVNHQ